MRVNCFINVSPENKPAFLEVFNLLAVESRKEPGCVSYELYENFSDPSSLLICETWKSKEDLEDHFQTAHYKEFGPKMRFFAELKTDKFE